MLTDNIENVCKEFDERLSRANSLLDGLHEKSSEWKNAFDERAKILDSVDKDMRDFFFQNSGFINVKNGRKISNMVYDAATLESGEKEFSFLLYEWYSQYEELLMQSFKFGWFAKGHGMQVTKARIIPQNVLDDFDRRLSNGENYNKVTKEFEDFLYENSRFQDLSYGWDLHYLVINRAYEDVFNFLDRRELCTLYNTYESLVLNALNMSELIKIRVY